VVETSLVRGGRSDEETEIARLEVEIASKRARVASSLGELRERVHRATSWRHWAAQPRVWIGAGVCLALIVGFGARRRLRLEE
jgi:hypothetical protein